MTTELFPEPASNGFTTLPHAEKRWFLIRVRELPHRASAKEQPALNCTATT